MSIHLQSKTPPSGGSSHPLPPRPAVPRPSGRTGLPGCPLRPAAHRPAAEPPLTWEELLGRR